MDDIAARGRDVQDQQQAREPFWRRSISVWQMIFGTTATFVGLAVSIGQPVSNLFASGTNHEYRITQIEKQQKSFSDSLEQIQRSLDGLASGAAAEKQAMLDLRDSVDQLAARLK